MDKANIALERGRRLLALRKKAGLSRGEFEEITGMSAHTLRYFENGERMLPLLKAKLLSNLFIHVLGLNPEEASVDFLLHGKNSGGGEEKKSPNS